MSLAKQASQSKSQQRRSRRKNNYAKLASWQQDLFHVKKRLSKEGSFAEQAATASKEQVDSSTAGAIYRGSSK